MKATIILLAVFMCAFLYFINISTLPISSFNKIDLYDVICFISIFCYAIATHFIHINIV